MQQRAFCQFSDYEGLFDCGLYFTTASDRMYDNVCNECMLLLELYSSALVPVPCNCNLMCCAPAAAAAAAAAAAPALESVPAFAQPSAAAAVARLAGLGSPPLLP